MSREPDSQPYSIDLAPGSAGYGWSVISKAKWPGQLVFTVDYDSSLAIPVRAPQPRKGEPPQ